ncbi:MAG: glycosyltransferase family 2 protein [Chitinophagaceae bacterium]|jgi:GT2 family glycosyltransferase
MRVTVSIVLYNPDDRVLHTIQNVLDATKNVSSILYLIDNSPTDAFKHIVADKFNSDKIVYLFNNKNIGFGAAHNIALRKELDKADYHLILNPDISFENGVIDALIQFMEANKNIGSVMPKILYPDGKLQYVAKLLPTPVDLIFKRFIPNIFIKNRLEKFQLKFTGYQQQMNVPYLSGCFMFLRTSVLKEVGLFDERFFMYPEDIDLTRRIHKKYPTMFIPDVTVIHEHEQGSYKNYRLLKIHILNMIKYFNKWGWVFDNERRKINKKVLEQFK